MATASSKQGTDDAEFSLEETLREMERTLYTSSPSGSEGADSAADRIRLTLSLMSLCSHSVTVLDDGGGADRFRASYAELFAGAYQDLFHWIMERPADEIDDRIWGKLFGDWESLISIEKTGVDPMCNITPHATLRFLSRALVYVFARASRGRAELPPDAVWDNFLCFHLGRLTFASLVDPSSSSSSPPPNGSPQALDRDAVARLGTVMAVALRRPGRKSDDDSTCSSSSSSCAASAACALARALASHAASRPLDELAPGSTPHLLDVLATALLAEGARRGAERRQRHRRAQRGINIDGRLEEVVVLDTDTDADGGAVVAGIARAAHEVLHYLVGIHARRRAGEHDADGRAAWLARREAALECLLRLRHRLPPRALSGLLGWLGDEAELCLELDVAGILETEAEAEEEEVAAGGGW